MDAPANAASWAITNSTKTIPTGIENMYHYKVVVNGTTAYLTVTKGSETVVDNEIMPVNGAGGIKGLYTTTSTALIESALEAAAPITAE